jgi:phenylacetate-CoA ligase
VERANGADPSKDKALRKNLENEIKKNILVSGAVTVVNYGELPRSERKSKRVFDNRDP